MVAGDLVFLWRFLLYVNFLPWKCSSACGCDLLMDGDEEEGWATVVGDDREDGKMKKKFIKILPKLGRGRYGWWRGTGLVGGCANGHGSSIASPFLMRLAHPRPYWLSVDFFGGKLNLKN